MASVSFSPNRGYVHESNSVFVVEYAECCTVVV